MKVKVTSPLPTVPADVEYVVKQARCTVCYSRVGCSECDKGMVSIEIPKVTDDFRVVLKRHEWLNIATDFYEEMGWKLEDTHREYNAVITEDDSHSRYKLTKTITDCFVKVQGDWLYAGSEESISKHSKSLCVGGPLAGQYSAGHPEYYSFNSAGRNTKHKTVLVHESCL